MNACGSASVPLFIPKTEFLLGGFVRMPANVQKSFRNSMLGGFNRKDVMLYIEKTAREYKEEGDTLRQQIDLMRSQRDEFKLKSEESKAENADLQERLSVSETAGAQVKTRLSELEAQLDCAKADNRRLSELYDQSERSLKNALGELDGMKERLSELESARTEFENTRKRIADIELDAYKRAEEIEKDAVRNSLAVRDTIKEMALKAIGKYNQVRTESESTAANVIRELECMRAWLMSFGNLFDGLDTVFERLGYQVGDRSGGEEAPVQEPFTEETASVEEPNLSDAEADGQ